jgi:hypothetical protein
MSRLRLPSPALAVALLALFVALSGTAVAAGVVPLAKRALTADKAKVAETANRLGDGQSAALVQRAAQTPGPASSAAGLVTTKAAAWSLGPSGDNDFAVTCDAGQKAISGGFDDPGGWAHSWDSRPSSDGRSWRIYLTVGSAPSTQTGTIFAVCLR